MRRDPFASRRVASWVLRQREHRLYAKLFGNVVASAWLRLSAAQRELLR